jgi:tripartite-type tricarboxylate transporter receptor subunit TctC
MTKPYCLTAILRSLRGAGTVGALLGLTVSAAHAGAVEEFYKGKTIDFVIGYSPGATYDLYARLVARHLGDHIPGNPRIIPRNMAGAGSRVAVNYVYKVAPKDGTVLGTADQSLPVEQAMGDQQLTIDVNQLNWIGNPIVSNNTTVSWYTSNINTIQDAMKQEVSVGATGASTSSQYPRAMNALIGTHFKVILGYPGANDINLAMERGEVAAKGSDSWAAWKATRADWLQNKKINILVQIGLKKSPEMPDVPLMMDLAKDDADRAVLKLLSTSVVIGRPIFAAPGVPAERVAALRKAFDDTMKDPEFLAEAKEAKLDLDPVSGEELQRLVADVVSTPKQISTRLVDIIGGPN